MDEQGLTRRDFITRLSSLMAAAYTLQMEDMAALAKGNTPSPHRPFGHGAAGRAQPAHSYILSPWTGDDFTLGHRMRSGDGPRLPKHTESKVDFVIVGGGNAGLTSAYRLRSENFILLEQYDDLGGTSRGNDANGIYYSMGAAYYSDEDGPVAQLVDKFGLKPAALSPEKNGFYFQNKWTVGVDGTDSNLLYRNFKKLRSDIAPVIKELGGSETSLPITSESLLKLDGVNFASMLTGYDPEFVQFVDRILMSSACADTNKTNALAGCILTSDFFDKSFVLPGGNPCLTRALAANVGARGNARAEVDRGGRAKGPLDPRLKTGCFVWSVDLREDGASVVYSDKAGRMHRVDCKHVIMATPPMVSGRIITGMKTKEKVPLFWFRYGSYLVANMICKKRVFKGTYDNFVPPPYEFSDITLAETPYLKDGSYKDAMGSVMTIYHPWLPGTMGRPVLEEGNREKLSRDLIKSISTFVPDLEPSIKKIVMTRWGHAINIMQLHYYEKISKLNSSFGDSYTISHSSARGIQCLETAVEAGNFAADRALKIKTKGVKSAT